MKGFFWKSFSYGMFNVFYGETIRADKSFSVNWLARTTLRSVETTDTSDAETSNRASFDWFNKNHQNNDRHNKKNNNSDNDTDMKVYKWDGARVHLQDVCISTTSVAAHGERLVIITLASVFISCVFIFAPRCCEVSTPRVETCGAGEELSEIRIHRIDLFVDPYGSTSTESSVFEYFHNAQLPFPSPFPETRFPHD